MKRITIIAIALIASYVTYAQVLNLGTGSGTNGKSSSTHIGKNAGNASQSHSSKNTLVGADAGKNTTGSGNSFFGYVAGERNITGGENVFIGNAAGLKNESGSGNIFIGYASGLDNESGDKNTYIGHRSGEFNDVGHYNTAIGFQAGYYGGGHQNVFIGKNAGYSETGSNKLYIDNSSTANPLIYGDFAIDELTINGSVDVCGVIRATEVIVEEGWCDYVFEPEYCLTTLEEEAEFIQLYGHLSNFESAKTMDGLINVNNIFKRQQVQIEENVLHLIELSKENKALQTEVDELKADYAFVIKEIADLKAQLK